MTVTRVTVEHNPRERADAMSHEPPATPGNAATVETVSVPDSSNRPAPAPQTPRASPVDGETDANRATTRRLAGPRLASVVYDGIKESLLDGDHRAGERLSVDELTRTFGVSKQPVMDALRRLAIDGLVEIIPQVGVEVARYTPEEIDDFFELFASVESTAAGLAATRRSTTQLEDLDAIGARIEALTHHTDAATRSHGYRVTNREYHGAIHTMAHSRIIVDYATRLWDLSDFLINTSGSPQPLHSALEQRHADHETIRTALHTQDAAAATRHMKHHILGTVDIIRAERSAQAEAPQ
jgi:DNA-binding GntR family transcriptional regulator